MAQIIASRSFALGCISSFVARHSQTRAQVNLNARLPRINLAARAIEPLNWVSFALALTCGWRVVCCAARLLRSCCFLCNHDNENNSSRVDCNCGRFCERLTQAQCAVSFNGPFVVCVVCAFSTGEPRIYKPLRSIFSLFSFFPIVQVNAKCIAR